MAQVLVSPDDIQDSQFFVRGPDAHHLVRVLRKKVGDVLDFFDGRGRRFEGRLVEIKDTPLVVCGQILRDMDQPSRRFQIHLFQGLPRGSKFDFVIEKAVELGLDSIVPFLSEKNIVQLTSAQKESKLKRWTNLAKAAAKQCNRTEIPTIGSALNFSDLLSRLTSSRTLVLWENEGAMNLKNALQNRPLNGVANVVVGPESGFSSSEIDRLREIGTTMISLGRRILRTETAGLAALSILNYEWGLF